MTTQQLEQRKQRWDRALKVLLFIVVGCVVGPFAAIAVGGLIALFTVWVLQVLFFAFAPVFTQWVAMKRLQALKALAAANPIETYETRFIEKSQALAHYVTAMNEYYASVQEVYRLIEAHHDQFPDKPSKWDEKYQRLVRGLQNRQAKFKRLKKALANYAEFIKEKKSDWSIAKSLAKSNRLANVGDDFERQMMDDEATQTINKELDMAFAEMDQSLLDEDVEQELADSHEKPTVTVTADVPRQGTKRPLLEMPKLDLGEEDITIPTLDAEPAPERELEPVPARRGRR
jgi:hypothetical protein